MRVIAERKGFGSWRLGGQYGISTFNTVDELVERSVHMTSEEVLEAARAMSLTRTEQRELASKLRRFLSRNLLSPTAAERQSLHASRHSVDA